MNDAMENMVCPHCKGHMTSASFNHAPDCLMLLPLPSDCKYCHGYTDSAGFHHEYNCPTLHNALEYSITVSNIVSNEQKIIQLLESIDGKLSRIYRELENIRLRMR